MRVVINGCGIAGPALAFWLLKAGHQPTLVEEAPRLRTGGYIIDFWGVGYDVVEMMGLIPRIKEVGYQVGEVRFVDDHGRRTAGFSTEVIRRLIHDRFTSLRRSDLAAVLYSAVANDVETIFGNSISAIEDGADGIQVTFDRGGARRFDLAIGADGLHSRVRRIAFGPDERFETQLGFHVAAFEAKGYRPRDELVYVSYTRPGRQVSRFAMRDGFTLFLFIFRDERLRAPAPSSNYERRSALRCIFGKDGWECPDILDAMDAAEDLYFDRVSQIRMSAWAKGRAALIGDAAACVSLLAGEGTGLAITAAYVLAGELVRAGGDYAAAFAAYQRKMSPLVRQKQQAATKFASAFAPASTLGIKVRDAALSLLRIPVLSKHLIGRDLHDDIQLPAYPWLI